MGKGIIPLNWRRANVKLYKPNYNLPSSYRPISLTSVVAKLMERIITYRLEGFVEMNNIMDQEREGFRHFRAYDSVWREGLMVKLYNDGIKGKMWMWINAFLSHREARCMVNNYKSPWFQTSIGLPQGSVISPILFNIFIQDILNPCLQLAVGLQMMQLFDNHIQIQKLYKKNCKKISIKYKNGAMIGE
ncbi:unnamed protein product [Mytilus edulis]|uniref:Reverse transcriptase domain-containing protein n=1 Tax=Mytilus edulis TaxID=6550 RepID=A0A8S3UDQ4_MYTED|nr:unnamed protein product [Mytilus edulis]